MNKNLLFGTLLLPGLLTAFQGVFPDFATAAPKNPQKATENKTIHKTAIDTALRYAEAIAKGDKITSGQLDFACQYRLLTMQSASLPNPRAAEASYESCWQELTAGHAPFLKRSDMGMNILWPSTGSL
ncbi:MAG: hypothetical protein AB7F94_12340, partial [Nitrospira sp.]